jgi:hypothetical protein
VPRLETHSVERKLAAIFAADVEGYSRLMGLDEVGTLRTLTAYRFIVDRPCLDLIREGDTLVVTKLDRLARSTQHLLEIADLVRRKRADLHILNLNVETSSAPGKLLLTMIAAVATFEQMMLERQREGRQGKEPGEVQMPQTDRTGTSG